MASTTTKKKFSFWKLLLWILILVVAANYEEILDTSSDYEPQSSRPSYSYDSGDDGDAQEESLSKQEQDTILTAVPEELRSNYFLTYKEQGCCKSMTGAIRVTVVMISDSVSNWDDASVAQLQESLNNSALDIVSEASGYGQSVSISFGYHHASLTGDICSGDYSNDWQQPALESAGLPGLSQIHDEMVHNYGVKEAPVLFVFNKDSRAYANVGRNEFLVLFKNDNFDGFQHELSHVFGAKDFYYPSEIKELAKTIFPDSVMNSGEIADPLTAYLIGWADAPNDSALRFLQETNHITKEYMDEQGDIESYTGYGTKTTDKGTYTGDMIRGVFHGTGTMQYNDGGWYTGEWNNGSWSGSGSGKYYYSNGSVYEGEFYNGKPHGSGKLIYSNGAVYEGTLKNGDCHGTGKITYPDGGWYSGGWDSDKWSGSGKGKNYYDDGSSYEGEFYDGKRHGTGTYKYTDGAVYTGGWKNGERSGTGTITYKNGGWYTGSWKEGKKSGNGTGKEVYDNGYYEGAFYNGDRHGEGTYTWSNGDQYTGQWKNGSRTGYGTYTWATGGSKTGTWENGKFIE